VQIWDINGGRSSKCLFVALARLSNRALFAKSRLVVKGEQRHEKDPGVMVSAARWVTDLEHPAVLSKQQPFLANIEV
jgi:hypothetical protein